MGGTAKLQESPAAGKDPNKKKLSTSIEENTNQPTPFLRRYVTLGDDATGPTDNKNCTETYKCLRNAVVKSKLSHGNCTADVKRDTYKQTSPDVITETKGTDCKGTSSDASKTTSDQSGTNTYKSITSSDNGTPDGITESCTYDCDEAKTTTDKSKMTEDSQEAQRTPQLEKNRDRTTTKKE